MGNGRMAVRACEMKSRFSWMKSAAVLAGLLVSTGDEVFAEGFIRVKETETEARLQTAVVRYEREGVKVDLIGAIHLADKRYYKHLNRKFEDYEVLLFEMVGGERLGGEGEVPEAVEEEEAAGGNLEGLAMLYGSMEKALGLESQARWIDYTAENFVHADLTMAEFNVLQKERGESLLSFVMQVARNAEKPKRDPNTLRLMRGLLSGRSDLVKLEMMHSMAAGDKQVKGMEDESVIITDRNVRCLEVMDGEVEKGRRKLGIFYGAAHFPDMEDRLLKMGFERKGAGWVTAWRVAKP